ncbi:hypothetical protein PPL_02396 [Heterostelium album PN500]|uniref:Elongation of fatty acids protein n=1 Tax=Heterostelium pallidum (strain ATCC 26659 / Pp 5 / PN500) TaxID=670386 RepID=D3AZL4_HETP5|nr:hypothetical protein PPL_02396 [Heterostelium album PN500]EFA85393.1 hypothetical protein PPL_02396 [Heterostelium album PN500]|eukprot:XP_020437502.1 hypothetical protein PPL_02396 [Heterostelium album PN500]
MIKQIFDRIFIFILLSRAPLALVDMLSNSLFVNVIYNKNKTIILIFDCHSCILRAAFQDIINYVNNFEWKTGVTPFSSIWTPAIATISYLVVIFALQEFMKNRKEIKLHYICLAHNLFLSLLSLAMFLGILIPLFRTEAPQGLYHLACQPVTKGQVEFFFYIFYLSKVYEFLDTVFLVLRKSYRSPRPSQKKTN